jgi:hypothetical protein
VVLGVGVVKTAVSWMHRSGLMEMYVKQREDCIIHRVGAPRHAADARAARGGECVPQGGDRYCVSTSIGCRIIELQGHEGSSGQSSVASSVSRRSLGQEMLGVMGKMKGGWGNTKSENVIQTIITQEEGTSFFLFISGGSYR